MNCPKCNAELPEKFKFCPECESSVSGISGESAQERQDVSVGDMRTLQGPPRPDGGDAPDVSLGELRTMQGPSSPRPSPPSSQSSSLSLADRYELGEEIGRGGFARVWKARDRKLDRTVAVKRLLDDKLEGPMGRQTIERFEREATAIAQLNHRNVVMVYDHDTDDDGHYVVMEYVEGGTLRDYVKSKGGKLDVQEAVELIKGIAQGLGYAHRKNLVHRDIKPANILLHRDGDELTPKIVDFGLARIGSESELSMSGYGMGTPWYMPPEQRRNAKGVNHTADIYALGKVLYELVSGETPDNVDPEKIPEPWLVPVILKCIKSSPEERYFSCEDLVRDLAGSTPAVATAQPSGAASDNACPQCGAATPEDAKFCEGCGAGLTRNCPECERENSVHKKFCAGCGTDVDGFLALQDIVGRMEKYLEAKKYSRVLKEAEQAAELKFKPRGDVGKGLAARYDELRSAADAASKKLVELRGIIESTWRSGTAPAPVEAALTSYGELAGGIPEDLSTIAARLPARKALARASGELDAADRLLQGGGWEEGRKALQGLKLDEAACEHPEDKGEYQGLTARREALLGEAERLRQQEIEVERARMDKAADDNDWASVREHAQRLLALCPGDEAAQRGIQRAGIEGRRIAMVQRAWDALNAGKYDVCQEACRKAIELVGEDFRIKADGFSGLCTELAALAKQRAAERAAERHRLRKRMATAAVIVFIALGALWMAAAARTEQHRRDFDDARSDGDFVTAVALARRLDGRHTDAAAFLEVWRQRSEVASYDTAFLRSVVESGDDRLRAGDFDGAAQVLRDGMAAVVAYEEAEAEYRHVLSEHRALLEEHGAELWQQIQELAPQGAAGADDPRSGREAYLEALAGLSDAVFEARAAQRGALITSTLADARRARDRQQWAEVVAAADRVLALDGNNSEAQALKSRAEERRREEEAARQRRAQSSVPAGFRIEEADGYESASGLPWTITHEQSGYRLKLVPAGDFRLGSAEGVGDSDERPQRGIYLDAYWIGETPVTSEQYAVFLNEKGNQTEGGVTWVNLGPAIKIERTGDRFRAKAGLGDHPVVEISWYGARAFARWLGGDLPTEPQWEKAAKGGREVTWPWGNTWDRNMANTAERIANVSEFGSYQDWRKWWEPFIQDTQRRNDYSDTTTPVKRYRPNGYGLYDMAGNVREWCLDYYAADAYRQLRDGQRNPSPVSKGDMVEVVYWQGGERKTERQECRVVRGGGWGNRAADARCGYRNRVQPAIRNTSAGVRVVVPPRP